MGIIKQGEIEISSKKSEAIDRLMQLQGICREELSDESRIEFTVFKSGKISIKNLSSRHNGISNATRLFGNVIERDGKAYISYYTNFSGADYILKLISLAVWILFCISGLLLTFFNGFDYPWGLVLLFCSVFYCFYFFSAFKNKSNSTDDSEILINELLKRVEAINNWDK